MEILQKARIAGAVMLATAGVAVGTAQADSLLAPLVISASNYQTYFNFKVPDGQNKLSPVGAYSDTIHYTWIKKGVSLGALTNPEHRMDACTITDNMGKTSANDMIFQDSDGNVATPSQPAAGVHPDSSTPNGYDATPFVGMAVITDSANTQDDAEHPEEGGMSGFAYIVNTATGDIQDYKLLNNHRSIKAGDFSSGFVAKKSVDLSWMGSAQATAEGDSIFPQTGWTVMVTGPDMAQDGGDYSSVYDASVVLSQDTRKVNGVTDATQDSPQAALAAYDINGVGSKGVVNNDEGYSSGELKIEITCMGSFTRDDLMDAQLLADTKYGGWARLSISPTDGTDGVAPHKASGAMVYRADAFAVPPHATPVLTMQVETSGHLTKGKNHPNRPF